MRQAAQLWQLLVVTGLVSVVTMVVGAALPNQVLVTLAGGLYGGAAVVVGWCFAGEGRTKGSSDALAARFARLISTTWGWAGIAMLGCHYLTDLRWQHAWQYGGGMLLIAALVWGYAGARTTPGSQLAGGRMVVVARWMTRLQGYAALAGVIVLALSGKIDAGKPDWAANVVFVAGGLAIFAISMAALRGEQFSHGR